jgi:hypothetical protein
MKNINSILLIIPPFTQLNTCYPSILYLKHYLSRQGYTVYTRDLSIETINRLYTREGLCSLFDNIPSRPDDFFLSRKEEYYSTVDCVKEFLQNNDQTLAHRIIKRDFLPEGPNFSRIDPQYQDSPFDTNELARHYGTLYFEDIAQAISSHIDRDFSLIKYKESLSVGASLFAPIEKKLSKPPTHLEEIYLQLISETVDTYKPDITAFSIPFPGNLFSALRMCKHLKKLRPELITAAGGGYINTELLEIKDTGIFNYIDYLLFNEGEYAFSQLLNFLKTGTKPDNVYYLSKGEIDKNRIVASPLPVNETLFPDYSTLDNTLYLSLIDSNNPMMRLWNDGKWNKLTMAHGCYWANCSFCDTSLDYIGNFKQLSVDQLLIRIKKCISDTGERGFHFVDEAAPPQLLKKLAIALIQNNINITFWTNIRFDRNFTPGLAKLLAKAGCIAISGGLEVASERVLKKVNKGVSLKDIIYASYNLSSAGILVHAYLMYGFPTQTESETIDALEVVRQLFVNNCIDSGFWHRFTLTCHSPVYANCKAFNIKADSKDFDFAHNDIVHHENQHMDHTVFHEPLNNALTAYMAGRDLDKDISTWFGQRVKKSIPHNFVENHIRGELYAQRKNFSLFYGKKIFCNEKGKINTLLVNYNNEEYSISINSKESEFITAFLKKYPLNAHISRVAFEELIKDYYREVDFLYASELWEFLSELAIWII